jgi:hypothetical protein
MSDAMPVITRGQAIAAGLPRFFTGLACEAGHICERYVAGGRCVQCKAIKQQQYRAANAGRVLEQRRAYDAGRREVNNRRAAEWRARNPEKVKASVQRWKEKNRPRISEYQRAHAEQRKESNRRRRRERRRTDPVFALQDVARARIYCAFRRAGFGKNTRTAELLGCSWPELKRHIEKQFLKGMTWENRGTVWHIDHIRALAEARSEEEAKALCHFTNLRPLWADANRRKSAKRTHLL